MTSALARSSAWLPGAAPDEEVVLVVLSELLLFYFILLVCCALLLCVFSIIDIILILSLEFGDKRNMKAAIDEIFANPYGELPLKNDKYAGNCTELHLGGRCINVLVDFEKFISLETLWLNDNRLASIEGLDENFRIKNLFLHGNRMRLLQKGSFTTFKFLLTLTLNDNLLDDMESTLQELRPLRQLVTLDLFNNPIAQEDNYRLRVLAELTSLTTFDRHKVTPEERKAARKLKIKMKKLMGFQLASTGPRSPSSSVGHDDEKHRLENALAVVMQLLRRHVREKRCFLEEDFLISDRRKLGVVTEDYFWDVLSKFKMSQSLSENEKSLLTDKYRCTAKVHSISITGTLPREAINYHRFCQDLLPQELRVVKDPYVQEKVPEVSTAVRALDTYVTTVKTRNRINEELTKKQTMLAGSLSAAGADALISFSSKSRGPSDDCGLSPWEVVELVKIVNEVEAAGGGEPVPPGQPAYLTKQQVENIFKRMSVFSKVPEVGRVQAKALLFRNDAKTVLSSDFRKVVGCPPAKKLTTAPATGGAATQANNLKIPQKASTGAVVPPSIGAGLDSSLRLRWRSMSDSELEKLEQRMFTESADHMESLLHGGGTGDTKELLGKTLSTSINATRLAARKAKKVVPKTYFTPSEVTATAGPRADLFVLPNLKLSSSARLVQNQYGGGTSTHTSGMALGFSSAAGKRSVRFDGGRPASGGVTGTSSTIGSSAAMNTMNTMTRAKTALPPPIEKGDPRLGGWAPGTKTIVIAP